MTETTKLVSGSDWILTKTSRSVAWLGAILFSISSTGCFSIEFHRTVTEVQQTDGALMSSSGDVIREGAEMENLSLRTVQKLQNPKKTQVAQSLSRSESPERVSVNAVIERDDAAENVSIVQYVPPQMNSNHLRLASFVDDVLVTFGETGTDLSEPFDEVQPVVRLESVPIQESRTRSNSEIPESVEKSSRSPSYFECVEDLRNSPGATLEFQPDLSNGTGNIPTYTVPDLPSSMVEIPARRP